MSTPSATLLSIEINNFKSFNGKRSLAIKGDSISVIGPNGSGKSNFMDAICFALGANTAVLRVPKLGDLIYGAIYDTSQSSEWSASVSLTFRTLENISPIQSETSFVSSSPVPPRVQQDQAPTRREPVGEESDSTNLDDFFVEQAPPQSIPQVPIHEPVREQSDSTNSDDFFVQRPPRAPVQRIIPVAEQPSYIAPVVQTNSSDENINTTVTFTRIVKQNVNGSCVSQYKINDTTVSATEYGQALNKIGINIKANVFLIFQGKIEEVATKTPTEFLDMFEHVCGSASHRDEYNDLERQLKAIRNQEESEQAGLKVLKREKQTLQRAAATAKVYNKLIEDAKSSEAMYFMFRLLRNEKAYNATNEKIDSLQVQLTELNQQLPLLEEALKSSKKIKGALERDVAVLDIDISKIKLDLDGKKCNITQSKETVEQARRKVTSTEKLFRESEKIHLNRVKCVEDLKNSVNQLTHMHEVKAKEFRDLDERLSLNASKLTEYNQLKSEIATRAGHLVQNLESLLRDRRVKEREMARYTDLIRMRAEEKARKELRISECETRIEKIQTNLSNGQTQLAEKVEARQSLELQISESKSKMDTLKSELKDLNTKIGDSKAAEFQKQKIETRMSIMKALQENFGTSKVIGRIQDLVKVSNQNYNLACWRIIGPHGPKIVVDSEATAIQCVRYLRDNELGVETFLPLDLANQRKLENCYRNIGLHCNMNTKLMIDVLLFEERIAPAVVWITNNTIICETCEQASHVAYETGDPKKNAVSIDGTHYSSSGIMYGGDVSCLEQSFQMNELQDLKARRTKLMEQSIDVSKKACREADVKVLEIEIRGLQTRNEMCKRNLKCEQDKLEDLRNDVQVLSTIDPQVEIKKQATECLVTGINADIQKVEKEIKNIEREIFGDFCASVGCDNVKIFEEMHYSQHVKRQGELQAIRNNINSAETQLMYENLELTEKIVQAKKNEYTQAQQTLELKEKELPALEEELAALESTLEQMKLSRARKQAKVDVAVNNVKKARVELEELQKKIRIIGKVIAEFLVQLQQIRALRHELLLETKNRKIELQFSVGGWDQFDPSATLMQSPLSHDPDRTAQLNREFVEIQINYSILEERYGMNIHLNYSDTVEKQLEGTMRDCEMKKNSHRPTKGDEDERIMSLKIQIQSKERALRGLYKNKVSLLSRFKTVKELRSQKFNHMFDYVNDNIDSTYKELTQSRGYAIFDIVVPDEPFEAGIMYTAMPQGRTYLDHKSISGGERTMSALAVILAIWKYKPSPFILLDEIDAALDNRNIEKISHFLASVPNMKCIAVTHKEQYYKRSDVLFGITNLNMRNTDLPLQSKILTMDCSLFRAVMTSAPIINIHPPVEQHQEREVTVEQHQQRDVTVEQHQQREVTVEQHQQREVTVEQHQDDEQS